MIGKCYSDRNGTTIKIFDKDEEDYVTGFLISENRSVRIDSWALLDYLFDGNRSFYPISKEEFDLKLDEAMEELKQEAK